MQKYNHEKNKLRAQLLHSISAPSPINSNISSTRPLFAASTSWRQQHRCKYMSDFR